MKELKASPIILPKRPPKIRLVGVRRAAVRASQRKGTFPLPGGTQT